MIIWIFFRPVFSFQLNLNISDEEAVIMKTPITIISIDEIINTFISFPLFRIALLSRWIASMTCNAKFFKSPIVIGPRC